MRNAYKILIRKSERNRTLERSRCRWENMTDIKMCLTVHVESVNWIYMAQDIISCTNCGLL